MKIEATVSCPIHDSFLVQKTAGMFDLDVDKKTTETFRVELPDLEDDWKIGAIVGPSGSGKSTIAKKAYGDRLYQTGDWPNDQSIVDGFSTKDLKQITQTLTSVGFSSPPSWLKPYHVLSNGEKFRCDLSRALIEAESGENKLCVFDEFTSVVDRTVAQIGSAALAKTVRKRFDTKFVAVSCHYDILDWLQPDWVLDMATCQLARSCLQRPQLHVNVYRCSRKAWRLFSKHHYLNTEALPSSSRCYIALLNDSIPIAFLSMMSHYGKKGYWRISRIVVLPDYQGIGVGVFVSESISQAYLQEGLHVTIKTAHPAMISHCKRSPKWLTRRVQKHGMKAGGMAKEYNHTTCQANRCSVTFKYKGSIDATAKTS